MLLLSLLKDLFSLNTLDSRLTTVSARPRQNPGPNSDGTRRPREVTGTPSKWNSIEFYFYYLFLAIAIPLMFKATYELSTEDHPNYKKYEELLSKGWLFGRKVDNSDNQYENVRDNLPILFAVLFFHAGLRRVFDKLYLRGTSQETADQRLSRRINFDLIFSFIFLAFLHGLSIFKLLFILTINYVIAMKYAGTIANPILTWIFNIGMLFLNEMFQGYRFAHMLPWLAAGEGGGFGHAMDELGGFMPRWEIHFNITMLRLVSFNMDYYWSHHHEGGSVMEKRHLEGGAISERDRIETPCKKEDYSFFNYLSYSLYSPLYLAGPILTFNDFIDQLRHPLPTNSLSRTLRYGIRLLVSIFTMEVILHYMYVVAISKTKDKGSWEGDTPFQLSMIGFFNLHIIWLKLLIPWRYFRLWSLVDNVDPPENMLRCMSDNYSATGFWRSWHRSFNRWIVRYIYVPLGGNKKFPVLNMLAVFTFVALWHDISLRLLAWGWLVTLFVLPEFVAQKLFPAGKFEGRETLYRHLCAAGAVGNILMMMAANLVGFAIGLDGLKVLISGILGGYDGIFYFLGACTALFVGAQVMFEHREDEKRRGIDLKC
ncbi:MBOAT, membrane-bound O-acyltransferase family-domain-containing protein [Terfezia claveryi]|nr:MBOAT, membrane-bound O-acyltransferase family-domain-containing protein [Terfezia claveryi]